MYLAGRVATRTKKTVHQIQTVIQWRMHKREETLAELNKQIQLARTELKNIRTTIDALKINQRTYKDSIQQELIELQCATNKVNEVQPTRRIDLHEVNWTPIGRIKSDFKYKNGTPRQPAICSTSTAKLTISKTVFSNPQHALEGLKDFSHIWIIFAFHENTKSHHPKAKVAPPRLDGKRIGVFSTRSPHRPNPIGLTLAAIHKIEGNTIFLSGVDIINGTPVFDIKPYIPMYDQPHGIFVNQVSSNNFNEETDPKMNLNETEKAEEFNITHDIHDEKLENQGITNDQCKEVSSCNLHMEHSNKDIHIPSWIESPPAKQLIVSFTPRCLQQLDSMETSINLTKSQQSWTSEMKEMITSVLKEDPRSVYRRNHCQDRLYYVSFGILHLTCWFDEDIVEVLKIKVNR